MTSTDLLIFTLTFVLRSATLVELHLYLYNLLVYYVIQELLILTKFRSKRVKIRE